jgi:hypothetical protein
MKSLFIAILCAACNLCSLSTRAIVKPNFFVINIDELC